MRERKAEGGRPGVPLEFPHSKDEIKAPKLSLKRVGTESSQIYTNVLGDSCSKVVSGEEAGNCSSPTAGLL